MTDADAFDAARQICRRHAKSFYFASHFLPRRKRRSAYAVYAFCRLLDDAVDESATASARAAALGLLDEVLDCCYAGRMDRLPAMPEQDRLALRAFADVAQTCDIPRQHFEALAQGCRMDLTIHRYGSWPELETYCYHVAGVVGLIMCHVFALQDPSVHANAVAMGNAMQLTNILRDIREDLARGRVYLPQDELDRFGVSEAALARGVVDEAFVELMRFQIERARSLYRQGAAGLFALPADGSRQTAAVMAGVYGGILGAIERAGYDVFSRRVHLSRWQKLRRVPGALWLARGRRAIA